MLCFSNWSAWMKFSIQKVSVFQIICLGCMIKNKLKNNGDKPELLLITWPYKMITTPIKSFVGQEVISQSPSCKSIGLRFNKHFAMDTQVNSICQSTHLHIRNIRELGHLFPSASAAQLLPSRSLHFWKTTMPYCICSHISCPLLCWCTELCYLCDSNHITWHYEVYYYHLVSHEEQDWSAGVSCLPD